MVNSMGYFNKKENNSLSRHGILGQKWGVRRFQNADGSLTERGKARAIKDSKTRWGYQKNQPSSAKSSALAGFTYGVAASTGKEPKLLSKALDKSNEADRVRWEAAKEQRRKFDSGEESEPANKGLSDSQKKALKIGAAAVGTALAAYGGYKMASNSIAKQNSIYSMYGNRRKGSSSINKKDIDITKLGKTVATTNKSFDRAFNVKGQQKFNRAAKANDDYVSQLLKKNSEALANYSMSDLMKLDLY